MDIIQFLHRSRIMFAISHDLRCYYDLQNEFWANLQIDVAATPPVFIIAIRQQTLIFSEEDLRRVLHFDEDDVNAPVRLDERMVKGCFLRMGFTGDINQALLHKACLSLQWKYFAHIMLHCLGNRKSWPRCDEIRSSKCHGCPSTESSLQLLEAYLGLHEGEHAEKWEGPIPDVPSIRAIDYR